MKGTVCKAAYSFTLALGILIISVQKNQADSAPAGLVLQQGYPTALDICHILGDSLEIRKYSTANNSLVGCPDTEVGAIEDRLSEGAKVVGSVQDWILLQIPTPQRLYDAEVAFSGNTHIFFNPEHGTIVDFFDTQGAAFQWYPGNTTAVQSTWKIIALPNRRMGLCIKFPTGSRDPVTWKAGGTWDCYDVQDIEAFSQNIILGDVFHLSGGKVPFVLDKFKQLSAEDLFKRASPTF